MLPYQQLYFTRDNQRLGYHHYANRGANLGVIILPAMGVPAGYYRRFALQLCERGANVTIADLRGVGSSSPKASRHNNFGYAELLDDVDEFLALITPQFAGRYVLLLGHSLGGQLASLHLARKHRNGAETGIDALGLVASGIPYRRLYGVRGPAVSTMAAYMRAVSNIRGHWPGHGFAGRQPRRLIDDWAHTVFHGEFVKIGGQQLHDHLAHITQPVHAVTIEGDYFTPPPTTRRLTDHMTHAPLSTYHYTRDTAQGPIDHIRWAKYADGLATHMLEFVADT